MYVTHVTIVKTNFANCCKGNVTFNYVNHILFYKNTPSSMLQVITMNANKHKTYNKQRAINTFSKFEVFYKIIIHRQESYRNIYP